MHSNHIAPLRYRQSLMTPCLTINLKASVEPASAAATVADMVFFEVGAIAGSTLAWHQDNPGGKAKLSGNSLMATATFTTLPSSNSSFGTKTAKVTLSGKEADSAPYEVFFARDASNHPEGSTPNWFYYWLQEHPNTNVAYVPAAGGGKTIGMTDWTYAAAPDKARINIGNGHPSKYASYLVGELTSGIDRFIMTVIHEEKHVAQIAAADKLMATTTGADLFRYGWSWNQSLHNHWSPGLDGKWGGKGIDDDANGVVDDAVAQPSPTTRPAFEPGNGDDASLDHASWVWWPKAWPLPPVYQANPRLHPIEVEAIRAADAAMDENDYAAKDWGHPGKQHATLNKWDD